MSTLPGSDIPATAEQQARMDAVTRAMAILDEAKVSYIMFSSPDSPSEQMKTIHSQKLSYATDPVEIAKQSGIAVKSFLWSALKTFSNGLNGLIALGDSKGIPRFLFQSGKVISVGEKEEPKVTA